MSATVDEARALPDTGVIVPGPFRPHAVRDGRPMTGQRQRSGAAAARFSSTHSDGRDGRGRR